MMKFEKGKKYICTGSNTSFYTVGKVYECQRRGMELGFYGNDDMFDNVHNLTARFKEDTK